MGFFTERGMQRSRRAALLPEVKRMLEGIDQIKKDFVGLNVDELHSSPSFETAWRDLLWVVGPRIWPETGHRVGAPIDQEFYPRPLVFLESEDRSM